MDRSDISSLIPALSSLIERAGTSPIKLEVALCDSEELKASKDRVEELEALVEGLRADYNRLEFKYRCESLVNMQLTDFCRDNNIKVPPQLLKPLGLS